MNLISVDLKIKINSLLVLLQNGWSFVVFPLQSYGSHLNIWVTDGKIFYTPYYEMIFYEIPKVWSFLPEISTKIFFLKIDILRAKMYTKSIPDKELCNLIPAPLSTQAFQASH